MKEEENLKKDGGGGETSSFSDFSFKKEDTKSLSEGELESFLPSPEAEDLVSEREKLEKEVEEYRKKWLYTQADLDNYKKRAGKERSELIRYGNEELMKSLLPIKDNLERAIKYAQESSGIKAFIEGITMVHDELIRALEKFGLQKVDSLGEKFDPAKHEALEEVENLECEEGTVVCEIQKGFFLYDRLLRPSLVAVSKKPTNQSKDGLTKNAK